MSRQSNDIKSRLVYNDGLIDDFFLQQLINDFPKQKSNQRILWNFVVNQIKVPIICNYNYHDFRSSIFKIPSEFSRVLSQITWP